MCALVTVANNRPTLRQLFANDSQTPETTVDGIVDGTLEFEQDFF
jgi:hypothetical protein